VIREAVEIRTTREFKSTIDELFLLPEVCENRSSLLHHIPKSVRNCHF